MDIKINQNELIEILSKSLGYPVKYVELKLIRYSGNEGRIVDDLIISTVDNEVLKKYSNRQNN